MSVGNEVFRIFCLLILLFPNLFICTVSLIWRIEGNHLILICNVRHISSGVTIRDPHGKIRGYCTAPIRNIVIGKCGAHLQQNIFNENTILTINYTDLDNGVWKCSHGYNTLDFATANVAVPTRTTEQTPNYAKVTALELKPNYTVVELKNNRTRQVHEDGTSVNNYSCLLLPLLYGYFIVLVWFILARTIYGNHAIHDFCRDIFFTKFVCLVVIPFVILLILPSFFMLIPGICAGKWWIFVNIVGIIITVPFYVKLVHKDRSSANNNAGDNMSQDGWNNLILEQQ